MKVYLVGGAVRDEMLGLPVKDRDWVVVGASIDEMHVAGYKPVGKDFPVFLHPQSREEYALARTERKTAPGYQGFAFDTSSQVTLTEDLQRRDLTINAMARDSDDQLIDPFDGAADLRARVLRHVSDAFAEDPVRILRVARFAARYASLGFTIATETMALMKTMVASGEVDALVAERVWQELRRALAESTPSAFIEVLRDCGALRRILPEVDVLFGVPQTAKYHPEVDTGLHVKLVLDQAARAGYSTRVVFACLLHDLGKALTPSEVLPSHRGHEKAGLEPVKQVCRRLKVPRSYQILAERVCQYHLKVHTAFELKAKTVLKLISAIDGLRQADRFEEFLQACEADARGRKGLEDQPYPQVGYLRRCRDAAAEVAVKALVESGLEGAKLGEAIHRLRLRAVASVSRS